MVALNHDTPANGAPKNGASKGRAARPVAFALSACLGAALWAAPAEARGFTCQGFMDAFNAAAGDMRVDFSRALSVGGRADGGYEYFDASGAGEVDVSVVCRGERFSRVEVRSSRGGSQRQRARLLRLEQAALSVVAGQDRGRAAALVRSLAVEAEDFLRASAERGDVYISGKTERHLGGGVDLGYVATETDLALIVVAGS